MNAWDSLRRVATDKKSGAAELSIRTGRALLELDEDKDILRAARKLLRIHKPMGSMWLVFALALSNKSALEQLLDILQEQSHQVARVAAGWALPKRAHVITHSSSSTVLATIRRAGRARIAGIVCTASLPGGEGRALAARLRREGFDARSVHDSEISRAMSESSVALCGADSVTQSRVINKVGTSLLALAARENGIPCYALAGSAKFVPDAIWPDAAASRARAYEATPVGLFDAIICERGALRPAQVRRAVANVHLPARLLAIK